MFVSHIVLRVPIIHYLLPSTQS